MERQRSGNQMQVRKFKAIFFSLLFSIFLFSCKSIPDNTDSIWSSTQYEIPVTTENILVTLSKTPDKNYFDFEIEGIKYTLLEIKQEGGNSLYVFHATDAKTWQEHMNLRSKGAIFEITFEFQQEYLRMDYFSYGLGYISKYNILDGTMCYENGRGMEREEQ